MRSIFTAERKLQKNEQGAAMIVVVCVLMVTMILCLTMIVGAYQTVASVSDGGRDATYYQQAMSFSDLVKKNLIGKEQIIAAEADATGLYEYLKSYACDMSDFTMEGGVEKKEDSVKISAETSALSGIYGDLKLFVKKKKLSSTGVRLFITVNVTEGDLVVATVTTGYNISNITPQPGNKAKADIAFMGYY